MKEFYREPFIEIIKFNTKDIINTSGEGEIGSRPNEGIDQED